MNKTIKKAESVIGRRQDKFDTLPETIDKQTDRCTS